MPPWQSVRKRTEDSPTVGFCNKLRIGSKDHEPTSRLTLGTQCLVREVDYESTSYTTNGDENTREGQSTREIASANKCQHNTPVRIAQKTRHFRKGSAPARLHLNHRRDNTSWDRRTDEPISSYLLSPLNKPLPSPPEAHGEYSQATYAKLLVSPRVPCSSNQSTITTIRYSPKPPTTLRLFPPSPPNSSESTYLEPLISSPTISMRPSWYLTQQISVFEDDDERMALIDYFKWPLHGGKSEARDRLRNLKRRGERYWKDVFCWPCGRI